MSPLPTPPAGRRLLPALVCTAFAATFLFGSYELIRSTAESIFLAEFGVTNKPWAMACVPFAMALFIYLYGRLLSAVGPLRAMSGAMLTSLALFLLSYVALRTGMKAAAFGLWVFKESYIVILAELLWSFVNSTLRLDEAKLANGPVVGLGGLGSLAGGWILSQYAVKLHTEPFILLAAAALVPAFALLVLAYRFGGEPAPAPDEAGGKRGHLHLSLFRENPTVLILALVIFCTQVLATFLDLRFSALAQEAFPLKDQRTAYLGAFWMKVNFVAISMQFVGTPLLLRFFPIRAVQAAIPALHLVSCAFLAFHGGLAAAAFAFLLFKGLDYSIFRASKETLYIPFSFDVRYRAKQLIDAFTYRFAKGSTALALSFTGAVVAIPAAAYALGGFLIAGVWLGLSFPLTAKRESKPERATFSAP